MNLAQAKLMENLKTLNMQNVVDLINDGADKETVLEAFLDKVIEEDVNFRSKFQSMMLIYKNKENLGENYYSAIKQITTSALTNSKYGTAFKLLLKNLNVAENVKDCGCN
ncbi:hypothetical protein NST88_09570 [Bacillus sp. PS68]|uniref:hypothetical protein n=1 Tax=Bacillus TaxID=1386 RepID=UPI00035F9CB6|nr:hypothetical protein [Bacillus subtilis]MBR0000216.1 hypothetical protein [Bacillus subtilis]MBR0003544.1 hypothetical protein [Bacillus subtilis]MDI6575080.1 hypothetical protein [Bacillus subtilis]MED4937660.1 hypothetical protein [Bacillus subtilis]WEZ11257.1 hypothetical protein P5622_15370 [Bacillus subtilis]